MAAAKRISDEPAYVLHSYDWSESSLILEVFCRRQGRVALVAKGAKKPSSNFRPVLLPLQPLLLTYTLAGDGAGGRRAVRARPLTAPPPETAPVAAPPICAPWR